MDRKEIVRRYKDTPRPAGIYRVFHRPSGRMLLGASPDAPAMLNRIQAQLGMGTHPNKQLQRDWDAAGQDMFDLEVLDVLATPDDPDADRSDDLRILHELWLEKLGIEAGSTY